MKVKGVVIGKRITFGAAVGSIVSFGVWFWNLRHPEAVIPAEQAVSITTGVTAIGQVLIANLFQITQVD